MVLKEAKFLLLLCVLPECHLQAHTRQTNGLRECRASSLTIPALEVLPGGGWDNLRNLDMGRVMNFSYSLCQTTEDGAYLIPDEVFVVPQKVTGVETNSEIISSWLDQRSSTAYTVNGDASFPSYLNAKFSVENQRIKTHQVKEKSVTTRVQVRNFMYTVKAQPDFTLDSRFAQQAGEIADALENNRTRQATFLSEKMILDYGTHVLTSVDAGASLVQEDYLRASFVSDGKTARSSITASAGMTFFKKVNIGIGGGTQHETNETQSYEGNTTYSLTQSHGGIPYYPGITLQKWQESTNNNLVAIDRAGLPLYYFLTRASLPNLPEPTVRRLSLFVRQAAERYYEINTHPGCVQPDSQNYNFQANVDDNSCDGPATNLSLGGVYQVCTALSTDAGPLCQSLEQKNPDTGDYSCRPPYTPTLLLTETREEAYSQYECHPHCKKHCFHKCCKSVCGNVYHVRRARVDTFWCSSTNAVPQSSGFLFGGFYGPTLQNPLTKCQTCPPNFLPLRFLSDGVKICLSQDKEEAIRFAVPFGGLFSCKSGNPSAKDELHCPPQFSQHMVAISDGCQVSYCVKSGLFTGEQLLPVRLPPFTRPPLISMIATNTVAIMTEGEHAWVRVGKTKMWKLADPEEVQMMGKLFHESSSELSEGEKFGLVAGVIIAVAVAISGIALLMKRRRRGGQTQRGGYEEMHSEGDAESQPGGAADAALERGNDDPSQPLLP
ncbi:hypothetical protein GJAV_G00025440 [Gymnothorax javanicus]|nr:hypothetical protein GJAV_G00025440 [Gymnothorax javanicus]